MDTDERGESPDRDGGRESAFGRILFTNNPVYKSVARVRIDNTTVDNDTVRITVEHAEHSGGVITWLVYERSNVKSRLKKHLTDSIEAELVDVEIIDTVDIGLSVTDLIEVPASNETQSSQTASSVEEES